MDELSRPFQSNAPYLVEAPVKNRNIVGYPWVSNLEMLNPLSGIMENWSGNSFSDKFLDVTVSDV